MSLPLIREARGVLHRSLLKHLLLVDGSGVPSNADRDSKASCDLASGMVNRLGNAVVAERLQGQFSGKRFEDFILAFVEATFCHLQHLRPGRWIVSKGGSIDRHEQYEHLASLRQAAEKDMAIAVALGNTYNISPDVVVARSLETDAALNGGGAIIDAETGTLAALRERAEASTNARAPASLLHASISCKWTMRSDRAQNSRTEALSLIRNRKGRVPHIVVVTAEPLPSRLESLALGTGDIDCLYHVALAELQAASVDVPGPHQRKLEVLVSGRRLKDIADLPLDLAV